MKSVIIDGAVDKMAIISFNWIESSKLTRKIRNENQIRSTNVRFFHLKIVLFFLCTIHKFDN